MLLNGWKEIAAYLKCGARTAQRWANTGLPVSRVGKSNRGAVMAFSEKLDRWVQRQGSVPPINHSTADMIATLKKTINQTSELMEKARQHQREFLEAEIAIGKRMAHLAKLSSRPEQMVRRTVAARRAFDVASSTLLRLQVLTKQEGKKLGDELRDLEHALQELRERL